MSRGAPLRALALLVAFAALGEAGCATHPHRGLGTAIDQGEERARVRVPESLRRGVRLPLVAVVATLPSKEEGEVPFDPRVIREELVRLLAATGIFEGAIAVGEDRTSPDLHLAKEEARSKDASFLIEATVERPSLERTDREFFVPLLIWASSGGPSMWYHSHSYNLELTLKLRLHDLNTGAVAVPLGPLEPARTADTLNFFERTGSVLYYVLSYAFPTPLLPDDDDTVARALAPAALARPVEQFLARLGEAAAKGGEVFRFARRTEAAFKGPAIEVRYPPADGRPLYLLRRTVRYAFVVEAPPGGFVREVRVDGRRFFPARGQPGDVRRARVPIVVTLPVRDGDAVAIEAWDSLERRSSCRVTTKVDRTASKGVAAHLLPGEAGGKSP
jgi:hypothetical protein